MPSVSIVLPTYNGMKYLRPAIDSCLNQTFRDLELILVVDGSTDSSLQIIESYHDPRLVLMVTENQGQTKALNHGFRFARGKYWTWTSDDNIYLPEAIQEMVTFLEEHPTAPMVSTDYHIINEDGNITGYCSSSNACFLYRAVVAHKVGEYLPEFEYVVDINFFLRLQHIGGPIRRILRPYYLYRMHSQSLSHKLIGSRILNSVKMHYAMHQQGIGIYEPKESFFSGIEQTALYHDHSNMNKLLDFASTENVPFQSALQRYARFCKTKLGWLYVKLKIASTSRIKAARQRILQRLQNHFAN